MCHLHIVKLFVFSHREQDFMVRCGNSLSTFRCWNGIRQGRQLQGGTKPSPPRNRHRVLCRRCLGKFTELCRWYGVTCTLGNCTSNTLGGISRIYRTSLNCTQHNKISMYAGPTNAITGSVLNKSQARKWGTWLCRGVSLPWTWHDFRVARL